MKKLWITLALLILISVVIGVININKKDEIVDNKVNTNTEVIKPNENESTTKPSEDRWSGDSSVNNDDDDLHRDVESDNSDETVTTPENVDKDETINPDKIETGSMVSEEDLVRVVVPDINKEFQDYMYTNLSSYRVEGDIKINEDIDYGITLDSDDIKKLITIIYEDTGCTSHRVFEETFAIFDTDPYDYSVCIELSDGSKYALYLVNGTCYAIADVE